MGAAYSCSNPGIKFNDDWYTDKYRNVYADRNNLRSLYNFKNLGFNNVRTYWIDPNQDHNTFLTTADNLGLAVEVGAYNFL